MFFYFFHGLNEHGFGWTLGVGDRQGGLACCDSWGRKESSYLFQNFPQFIVIHTVKVFGIVDKGEVDVFLELCCFFDFSRAPCGPGGRSRAREKWVARGRGLPPTAGGRSLRWSLPACPVRTSESARSRYQRDWRSGRSRAGRTPASPPPSESSAFRAVSRLAAAEEGA